MYKDVNINELDSVLSKSDLNKLEPYKKELKNKRSATAQSCV